jgi:putative endonuclease
LAQHNKLGELGEEMALTHLVKNGYIIQEKNWRFQKAEIDIIAQKGETLVCVEVKTRSTSEFGDPQDFVDSKKIKLLVKAMNQYVEVNNLDVEVRFDIIAIIHNQYKTALDHIEDAFLYFD